MRYRVCVKDRPYRGFKRVSDAAYVARQLQECVEGVHIRLEGWK